MGKKGFMQEPDEPEKKPATFKDFTDIGIQPEKRIFWKVSHTGAVSPFYPSFYKWLAERGYRLHIDETNPDNPRTEILKLDGKFLIYADCDKFTEITIDVKRFLLKEHTDYKERVWVGVNNPQPIDIDSEKVLDVIQKHSYKKLLDKPNWTGLPVEKPHIVTDNFRECWQFFKNKAVQITKDGFHTVEYSDIKGYVKKALVQPVNIDELQLDIFNEGYRAIAPKAWDFLDFMGKICLQPHPENEDCQKALNTRWTSERAKQDWLKELEKNGIIYDNGQFLSVNKEKRKYLFQLLGYLMHGYKQGGLTDFYPFFLDDEGGGSGKGILFKGLAQIVNVCDIDATGYVSERDARQEKSPAKLTRDTRVKLYNDTPKTFPLKVLRNETTDSQSIEYKFKDKIILRPNEGWKTACTSNYLPRGSEDAEMRRMRPFFMYRFFNKNRSVRGYYGHTFFDEDWSKEDWQFFYNIMFHCVVEWLKADYKLSFEDKYLDSMKLERYSSEFREFMDAVLLGINNGLQMQQTFVTGGLWDRYKEECKAYTARNTSQWFGKYLTDYLTDAGYGWQKNHNRTEITIWKIKEKE